MKLVTVEQMRAIDQATIAGSVNGASAIASSELMERAGKGIADAIWEDFFADSEKKRVTFFCGKGNNGGDGFVAARHLAAMGCFVTVYTIEKAPGMSDDSRENFELLAKSDIKPHYVSKISSLPQSLSTDVIVDALLGSGAQGAPKGIIAELVEYINRQDDPVAAIDNPTGLDADTGQPHKTAISATFTYSIGLAKRGHFLHPGPEHCGVTRVIDIGIPEVVVENFDIRDNLITPEIVAAKLPERPPESHKGLFGRLFLIVGSTGLVGAGALATRAALRSGIGLATIGCPDTLELLYQSKIDEATTVGLPSVAKRGRLSLRAHGKVIESEKIANATVLGPGLGRHRDTEELVRRLLTKLQKPFVLDADGLNAFEKNNTALQSDHVACVMTPHPGEFKRLTGQSTPEKFPEKVAALRDASAKFKSVIVLKGAPSLICSPDGQVYLNPLGNSGMATGGSGDVLSGVIGAMLAQGLDTLDAAIVGAYIHSLAGDLAAGDLGERSLIAGDIIDHLPEAFRIIEEHY